ncbi:MAG: hypothetical protein IPN34_05630 [Planctomycetes bacterium]|nr:hypothetical protein [Planctomycetota bacterium]
MLDSWLSAASTVLELSSSSGALEFLAPVDLAPSADAGIAIGRELLSALPDGLSAALPHDESVPAAGSPASPVRNFSDFIIIGLTMNIVGTFFLANSIVFKRPRRVIEEFFVSRPGSLLEIRDYIFTKIQVIIGFVFVFCGFGLQIVAHVDKLADPTIFLVVAIAAIFLTAFLIGTIGYATSRRAFKRYLKDFFRKNPWPFARNMGLTQEIGEIFGIPKSPDDTVEMYCAKLRRELKLPEPSESDRNDSRSSGIRLGGSRGDS